MDARALLLLTLMPWAAFAADFKDLKAGVAIRLSADTRVYDLDTAHHPFRDSRLPRWTTEDEGAPVAIFGWGLKRRRLPAGTEGVMIKDAYVNLISRNRNYADCVVVFAVNGRHFVIINSDSTMDDDENALISLVRTFPTVAALPPPGAVATLIKAD